MRRVLVAGVLALLAMGVGQTQAQTPTQTQGFTGGGLARLCHWLAEPTPAKSASTPAPKSGATAKQADNTPPAGDINRCVARILGTIDGVVAGENTSGGKPKICLPPTTSASVSDRTNAVRKYTGQHLDMLKDSAGSLVRAALEATYPCH
jgi:hypothetical protein